MGQIMRKVIRSVACFILIVFCLALLCTGCTNRRIASYYADTRHFSTGEAVVENIIYKEDFAGRGSEAVVLWLSGMDDAYADSSFVVEGENARILLENGFMDKVAVGDTVTFTSSPQIFYDGWFFPIVDLEANGARFLDFETGYANLMDLYR